MISLIGKKYEVTILEAGSPENLVQLGLACYGLVESEVEENHTKGFDYILLAARENYPEAQYLLGLFYSDDDMLFPETDMEESREWYIKAANNKHPRATTEMGIKYLQNAATLFEIEEAERLLSQAHELGDARGINALGLLFQNKKTDFDLAFRYFSESAEMGYSMASVNLARLYVSGNGTKIDIDIAAGLAIKSIGEISDSYYAAYGLLEKIADEPYHNGIAKNAMGERAIRSAKYNLSQIMNSTSSIIANADPTGRVTLSFAAVKASDRSKLWENMASIDKVLGNIAEMEGSFINLEKEQFNKDIQEAHEWFDAAAKIGNSQSLFHLGMMSRPGILGVGSVDTAKHFLGLAAEQGVCGANLQLALLEDEFNPNSKEAFDLFQLCAVNNDAIAQYEVGRRYDFGHGLTPNHTQAAIWYERAIMNSDLGEEASVISSFNLGLLYSEGLGVENSIESAYSHIVFAASTCEIKSILDTELISQIKGTMENLKKDLTAEQIDRLNRTNKGHEVLGK